MSKFDTTRENIRTTELSEKERKDIFQKFVDSGGKVETEKRKKHSTFDRNKQREFIQKSEERKHNYAKKKPLTNKRASSRNQATQKPSSSKTKKSNEYQNPIIKMVTLLRIRFNLFINGITDFSGLILKNSFLKHFNQEYKSSVIEMQLVYLDIFKKSGHDISEKIVERLDKENPILFELIEFGANIYDRNVTSTIIDEYIAFGDKEYRTFDMAEAFSEYFKRIYLIISFQDTLFSAYDKAIKYHSKLTSSNFAAQQRRKVKNSIYIACNKFFPKLYWLFCLFNSQIISLYDISIIDEILELTPEMKPGTRQPHSPSRLSNELAVKTKEQKDREHEEEMDQAKEEIKKKSTPIISDEIKQGLKLMSEIKVKELAKKFIKKQLLISEYRNNPIIRTFLVFREFDEEYSILFTTNKIKVSVPTDRRHDTDYRIKLSDLYNKIRHIDNQFKEYFNSFEMLHNAINDKPTTQNQYYHYSKRLTELEHDLKTRAKTLRNIIKDYMGEVIDLFEEMAKDMESSQQIVQNPQEEIELDYELEGNKKLKGKKIYQAIAQVINFSYALIHRLSHGNDLSESDAKEKKSNTNESTPQAEEILTKKSKSQEEPDVLAAAQNDETLTGSVIDELESFL